MNEPTPKPSENLPKGTPIYRIVDDKDILVTKMTCTGCNTLSDHESYEVIPMPLNIEMDIPFDMKRRISMCTYCGKMSLKK